MITKISQINTTTMKTFAIDGIANIKALTMI